MYSVGKEQTEKGQRKKGQDEQKERTPNIVATDSEQRDRRKRIETKDKIILETIQEGRKEEEYSGESYTERYTRYKTSVWHSRHRAGEKKQCVTMKSAMTKGTGGKV